jgi:hypothetical protein
MIEADEASFTQNIIYTHINKEKLTEAGQN